MNAKEELYRTGKARGLFWTYRAGMEHLTCPDYARQLIAANENRVRLRGRYKTGGKTYFVKVFKEAGLGRAVKSALLGHVAKKEFVASRYLTSRGIRTPDALAVGVAPRFEDRAVIVLREINGAVPVQGLFLKARPDERGKYLDAVAETTAALHRASFYHRDYHAGNLLAAADGAGAEPLWVIDLHRSSFPRDMSGARGLANIADMVHSLMPAMGRGDISRFLSRYRQGNPAARWDSAAAERVIEDRVRKIEARRVKSRTKRCFINSSSFFVSKSRMEIIYGRRGISPDEIGQLIGQFTRGEGRLVKKDKKASVALVKTDHTEICIKAYERLGFFGRIKAIFGRSRGHNSWRAAQGLSVRGFDVPRHLCLVIRRRLFIPQAVYLVTESMAPRLEMGRFIVRNLADGPRDAPARFAASLGTLIGVLHRAGIYHRDLKSTNIAADNKGGDYSFAFLDLDSVAFSRSVSMTRRAKNLSQIYLSCPGVITAGARKVFFEAYISASAASGGQGAKKTLARLVGDLVKGKDIRYVSDGGDVVEDAHGLYKELWGDG
jgi:tRNA A-37 threonylcarbamoyl transferase component Bud32